MIDKQLSTWKQCGRFVKTSQGKLFVRSQGQGPCLLLVHGFPTSSWDWHCVESQLAEHFQVISFDMLGYGFSDKPANVEYSTPMQVELINELLESLSIRSAHLMTYSYGVSVVQEMLRQSQASNLELAVDSVCFMNGGLFPDSNHPRVAQKLMLGPLGWLFVRLFNKKTLGRNIKSIFGPNTQPAEQLIDQYWKLINYNRGRPILPRLIQYLAERKSYMHSWEHALKNARCPIQLIVGDHDEISGVEVAEEFAQKISNDNIHILNGIGHYPQLEDPERVCDLYVQFISSLEQA